VGWTRNLNNTNLKKQSGASALANTCTG
jgi:hypothetical protein